MEAINWSYFEKVRRQYDLRDLLDDEWKHSVKSAPYMFGTPFGRAWWSDIRELWGMNEYGTAIDDALNQDVATRQMDHFDRVKAAIPRFLENRAH